MGRPEATTGPALRPSLVDRLTTLQRRAARALSTVLVQDGCTLEQWRVLRALGDGEGHAMGQLAEDLQVPAPTLTRVTDSLADAALVYRRHAGVDRRRVLLHLSRQGRRRLDGLEALVAAHETALLASPPWAAAAAELAGLLAQDGHARSRRGPGGTSRPLA